MLPRTNKDLTKHLRATAKKLETKGLPDINLGSGVPQLAHEINMKVESFIRRMQGEIALANKAEAAAKAKEKAASKPAKSSSKEAAL